LTDSNAEINTEANPEARTPPRERHGPDAATLLRDPALIRSRCAAITQAVGAGRSANFKLDRSRLADVAQRVEQVTRAAYPDLRIPYHSRWRHFEAGGVDRKAQMDVLMSGMNTFDQARARIDLSVVSVLLDAGAGPAWQFTEAQTGQAFSRSEGLGVASFRAFMAGAFSAVPDEPLRVDASVLRQLDASALAALFQAGPNNPMVGLEGRAALLQRLGEALQTQAAKQGGAARPAALFDTLTEGGTLREISAAAVLRALLDSFASIWLTGSVLHGVPLGDVWPHRWAGGEDPMAGRHGTTDGWVPFHKLSQWLTYSLLEPFEWAGISVGSLDALTGLPEYRNGGLLIDGGVIVPRDSAALTRPWKVSDEFIIEWRALTVTLIDELAPLVRERLNRTAQEMPLACVLEGGTWAAGRAIARGLREGGRPPITIDSDGTVF
jgi:Protein of unknown function (DUF1688)